MTRDLMKHLTMILSLLCFMMPSLAVSAASPDPCLDCHGYKGAQKFFDRSLFDQSVHSGMACSKCHLGVSGYPHNKPAAVNCGICHFLGREGAPMEKALEYKLSVHGRAQATGNTAAPSCQTCHGSHYIFPSRDTRSATRKANIPALCGRCHPAESQEYRGSVHGKALFEKNIAHAPTCFDCHLEHLIPKTGDDQWKLALVRQCGTCHAEEIKTYRKTYHGKVTQLGYTTIAKCSDCHGSHGIAALSDTASLLSQQNILATCRKCHPKATAGFTKYYAHASEENRDKYPVLYYTYLFMTALLLGVFTFFLTHTFLWAHRALKERIARKGGG